MKPRDCPQISEESSTESEMQALHSWMGWSAIAAFVVTGFYMELSFPEAHQGDRGARMMYRSAHVYILLSGLGHLLLGSSWSARGTPWAARLQHLGSASLLLGPPAFGVAFFAEPNPHDLARPYVLSGLIASLVGTAFHLASGWAERAPSRTDGGG